MMTFCLPDEAPAEWTRVEATNDRLVELSQYLSERPDVKATLSGALSYGVMEWFGGPNPTTVAFEDKNEAEKFKQWYATLPPPGEQGIVVAVDHLKDDQ